MKKINDSTYENNNDYKDIPSEPNTLATGYAVQQHILERLFIERDQRALTEQQAREMINIFE